MMKEKIMNITDMVAGGAIAGGAVEALHTVPFPGQAGEVIKWICQAIIAIATIYGVRKKTRKKKIDSDSE